MDIFLWLAVIYFLPPSRWCEKKELRWVRGLTYFLDSANIFAV